MKKIIFIVFSLVIVLASCNENQTLNPENELGISLPSVVSADSVGQNVSSHKVRTDNSVSYTSSPVLNSWTVATSGSTLRLNCASYDPGIRTKIIAQSGNRFTVQIQRNDGRAFGGTGIAYIKASNLCGNIAGSSNITNSNHYYINVDFWATFNSGWVAFYPTITINGKRLYANPLTITAKNIETAVKDNCSHLTNSQCVEYARCRKSSLPYGLFSYSDKVKIINTYTPSANTVAIIKVGSGTNGNGVGHVAFVEKVENGIVFIAESNWVVGKINRRSGTMSQLGITGFYK